MDDINLDEVNAKLQILENQRNKAMNEVVMIQTQLALVSKELEELKAKNSKVVDLPEKVVN